MLWRWATASGPVIRTSARSGITLMTAAYNRAAAFREAADYADGPHRHRPQGPRGRHRRVAHPAGPVLHRQVARAARRERAARRPGGLGLPCVRARPPPAAALSRRAEGAG